MYYTTQNAIYNSWCIREHLVLSDGPRIDQVLAYTSSHESKSGNSTGTSKEYHQIMSIRIITIISLSKNSPVGCTASRRLNRYLIGDRFSSTSMDIIINRSRVLLIYLWYYVHTGYIHTKKYIQNTNYSDNDIIQGTQVLYWLIGYNCMSSISHHNKIAMWYNRLYDSEKRRKGKWFLLILKPNIQHVWISISEIDRSMQYRWQEWTIFLDSFPLTY